MLNLRYLSVLILAFLCAVSASAQNKEPAVTKNPPVKPVVANPGKTPPKLKPAPASLVKKELAKKKTDTPATEKAEKTAEKTTAQEHSSSAAATLETGEAAAAKKEPKTPHSAPGDKTAIAEAPAAVAKKSAAQKKTTALKIAPKKAPVKEVKKEPVTTTAVKKVETKRETPVAAVKKPEVKKENPAIAAVKKAEPKKRTTPPAKAKVKVIETEDNSPVAREIAPAPQPKKVWLPPINADDVKTDINGTTLIDIPGEMTGDGAANWSFTANQPKEIEIIKTNQRAGEIVVDARLSAKKAKANFDGSYDRVRGVARLYYKRASSRWELKNVENISLRHSDTNMDSPIPSSLPAPITDSAASVISAPPFNIVPGGRTLEVGAGKYSSYSFRVEDRAVVTGRFQAQGGRQNDIEAYILDQDGFQNWTNDHAAPAYYNSGRLTVGSIETPLSAGTYYLVFNNRYAAAESKTVEASIQLRSDSASLARFDQTAELSNGKNSGPTINTIRRTYAPSANPAPAFVRPVEKTTTAVARTQQPPEQPAAKQQMTVAGYESDSVISGTFNVDGGQHHAIPFTVKQGGAVRGSFSVAGGFGGEVIDAYIMTANEYNRWANYREGVMDYSSGRAANGRIDRKLGEGDYYLVFSNHFAPREGKTVQAEMRVEYNPR